MVCLGDFNINLDHLEEPTYYLKKLSEEYQMMIGECGLETLYFGITWSRTIKDKIVKSAVDHGFTNKPNLINSHYKTPIDYSDHDMICVVLNMNIARLRTYTITSRDMRKLRSNPNFFLNELLKIITNHDFNLKFFIDVQFSVFH